MLQLDRSAQSDCLMGLAFAFDFPTRNHWQADDSNLLLVALQRSGRSAEVPERSLRRMTAILKDFEGPDRRLTSMRREFQRLFENPSPKVPPYESAYREKEESRGETAVRLRALYRDAGLEISSNFRDLPDHICLELECLAQLLAREQDGDPTASRSRQHLQENLQSWLPSFCSLLATETSDPYYQELALLSEGIVCSGRGVVS